MAVEFGERLRELREERGVSQYRLAQRSGLTAGIVSRWEAGLRSPSREAVGRIADALGLEEATRVELLLLAGYSPWIGPEWEPEVLEDTVRMLAGVP